MGKKQLSNRYLSAFMLELALLLQAGLTLGDGLALMAEDDDDADSRALLLQLADQVGQGRPLSAALSGSGRFPDYVADMTAIGEASGRQEETCRALAAYYDDRERLNIDLRNSILYPLILLLLMLAVITVLLVKVLPVFNAAYAQLGGALSGLAAGLLRLGQWLSGASLLLALLLGLLLLTALLLLHPRARAYALRRYYAWRGDQGLAAAIIVSRLAAALSMALRSGLNSEQALDLAMRLTAQSPRLAARLEQARASLAAGRGLPEALSQSGVFPAMYGRMLALGVKSGSADTVMAEIARRMRESVEDGLNSRLNRVEPTLVIIASLLMGLILLSVMLPLVNIMSVLG